jgi:hypothetical protein
MLPRLVFLKDLSLKNEIFNQTTYILNIKPGFLIIYKKNISNSVTGLAFIRQSSMVRSWVGKKRGAG